MIPPEQPTIASPPLGFDASVATAVNIDRFCSSTTWVVPAHAAFHGGSQPSWWSDGESFVALASGESPTLGTFMAPIEAVWGLASPIICRAAADGGGAAREALAAAGPDWRVTLITGIETRSPLFGSLAATLGAKYRLRSTMETTRYSASLEGGLDGFLGRRSRKFRANLRRVSRRAPDGLTFERVPLDSSAAVDDAYGRVLSIERRSWKSISGNGVAAGPMVGFTHGVLCAAAARDGASLIVCRDADGRDIGYIHGARNGGYFRGLQMSYDNEVRTLGLGNLLQLSMLEWLCEDGIEVYDLGSELPYKLRWAERSLRTTGMVVLR